MTVLICWNSIFWEFFSICMVGPALCIIPVENSSWLAAASPKANLTELVPDLSLHVLNTSVQSGLLCSSVKWGESVRRKINAVSTVILINSLLNPALFPRNLEKFPSYPITSYQVSYTANLYCITVSLNCTRPAGICYTVKCYCFLILTEHTGMFVFGKLCL